jgi:hypothetical protein
MLNNDIHNSTILPKPSKADFVRMNTSGDEVEHAPQVRVSLSLSLHHMSAK